MNNMYEDRELVNKILNGNKQAFSFLVKQYEKLVWCLVSRMVLDEDELKIFVRKYLSRFTLIWKNSNLIPNYPHGLQPFLID